MLEQVFVGVMAMGVAIGLLDGLNRGIIVLVGALVVLIYPFVESQALVGVVPWTPAFETGSQFIIIDGAIWILAAFLVPYTVVRLLFMIGRRNAAA